MLFMINEKLYVLTIVGYVDNKLLNKHKREPMFNLFSLHNFSRWLDVPCNYRKLELELQRAKANYMGKTYDIEKATISLLLDGLEF